MTKLLYNTSSKQRPSHPKNHEKKKKGTGWQILSESFLIFFFSKWPHRSADINAFLETSGTELPPYLAKIDIFNHKE